MGTYDVRQFINECERLGDLKRIDGAEWDLEIGALTDLYRRRKVVLFDNINGYTPGFRVLTNIFATDKQQKMVLGAPPEIGTLETVKFVRDKFAQIQRISPVKVKSGPVLENVLMGTEIDLLKFPVPRWHELDGGRYIGTANLVVTRDPDEGWVNAGTYRVMVHDKKTAGCFMAPSRHGRMMMQKYWRKGESCPVAVVCGQDPLLLTVSSISVPYGVCEYEYAGWFRGKPVEIIEAPITGLPVPASAEIVIEGEIPPPEVESRKEGPFGEWTGYYGSGTRMEPIIQVKSILHRNDPILCGVSAGSVPSESRRDLISSAIMWDQMEKAGVPDIRGVWRIEPGGSWLLTAISIKQRYPGHARQAGLAAVSCREGSNLNRFTIVVDDDIDPTNEDDVWWAMATRCDPATSIDILPEGPSEPLDPMLDPEKRKVGNYTNSKAVINACRPYHWIDSFPTVVKMSTELRDRILKKYKDVLTDLSKADLERAANAKVAR
ncbi:UbiD family decarboxylase [bacterium]|nr:UbiD family decarboxylase [bacterium]